MSIKDGMRRRLVQRYSSTKPVQPRLLRSEKEQAAGATVDAMR
jgi:hypothetical protein